MTRAILAFALGVVLTTTAYAADLLEGWTAFEAGDYERVWEAWLPLAEAGNATAQYNVGILYENGYGVDVDYAAAAAWYRRAADQDDTDAQYSLGVMFQTGLGVTQDYDEAVRLFEQAAAAGDVDAQFSLAFMFETGVGVDPDLDEALKWYRLAAEQGDPDAQEAVDRLSGTDEDLTSAQ